MQDRARGRDIEHKSREQGRESGDTTGFHRHSCVDSGLPIFLFLIAAVD
jgi:hypothetical protein